jgi:CRP/FNR family transcriptional regulator, cyclic AMP receptor protein
MSEKINEPTSQQAASQDSTPALAKAIAEHPFWKGMSPDHLKILVDCAMYSRFEAGQLIFEEGDPANRFYLILEGNVLLESYVRERGTVLIEKIGAGDVLGWSWLFPPCYWHFDARALEPTKAIFFYGTRLRERCEEDHEFAYQLLRRTAEVVIRRLQATRRQLLDAHNMKA